jgi:hypothetical protein
MPLKVTWKTILAAVVALILIVFNVDGILKGDEDDSKTPSEEVESAEFDCNVKSSSKRKKRKVDKSWLKGRPVVQLAWELGKLETKGRLGLKSFRKELKKQRLKINMLLVVRTVDARSRWLDGFSRVLEYLSLAALLLLLGPLFLFAAVPEEMERRSVALKSIPFFIITTAAVLLVANGLVSIVVGVQKLQVSLAAFGTPRAAVTDAVMHYVIYTDDVQFMQLAALVGKAHAALKQHPILVVGLLDYLWRGLQVLQNSAVFLWTRRGLSAVARLMDLYGPLIAIAAMVLVYQVVVPVVRNLVRYPIRVLTRQQDAGVWVFIKDQFRVLWREFKTSFWMFLFILVFTAVAVALVRLLVFPMVVVCIKTILSVKTLLMAGGKVPTVGMALSMLSVAVFLILVCGLTLLPVGVVLSKAYFVVRTRAYTKRKYREFPVFWQTVRRVATHVVALTALLAGVITGIYFLLMYLVDNPTARIWIPAPLFGPVLGVALWRFRVFGNVVSCLKADALTEPEPEEKEEEKEAVEEQKQEEKEEEKEEVKEEEPEVQELKEEEKEDENQKEKDPVS